MLVGIMSDSHDDMQRIQAAVEFFNAEGAAQVVHAGDLVSPFTFEVLGGLGCPFTAIFGNNDGDRLLLREKSGDRVHVQPHALDLGGLSTVLVHEPTSVEALARSGDFNMVVYGHSHTPDIRNISGTLVINPGKTARLHKGESTIALLDTELADARIITSF
jgi:putative phosphoesterase